MRRRLLINGTGSSITNTTLNFYVDDVLFDAEDKSGFITLRAPITYDVNEVTDLTAEIIVWGELANGEAGEIPMELKEWSWYQESVDDVNNLFIDIEVGLSSSNSSSYIDMHLSKMTGTITFISGEEVYTADINKGSAGITIYSWSAGGWVDMYAEERNTGVLVNAQIFSSGFDAADAGIYLEEGPLDVENVSAGSALFNLLVSDDYHYLYYYYGSNIDLWDLVWYSADWSLIKDEDGYIYIQLDFTTIVDFESLTYLTWQEAEDDKYRYMENELTDCSFTVTFKDKNQNTITWEV